MSITLDGLRRFAVNRSFPPAASLRKALHKIGFVQADPIRAPARAQDLILRHRVKEYRAGDLERHYANLGIEEDYFVVYGFLPKSVQALMHPRSESGRPAEGSAPWPAAQKKTAQALLDFVRDRGEAHPWEVDKHFSHGTVKNFFGGSTNATTDLLAAMHYRGMVRVARREGGTRVYSAVEHGPEPADIAERHARIDALVDVAAGIYSPMPGACLTDLVHRLRHGVPQWRGELKGALQRARQRLTHARVDGVDWYWPGKTKLSEPEDGVRLLAPFDPLVWDRDRFELLWGWVYRFEAYTPAPKRIRGYYALPMLWRDRVIGWANLSVKDGRLQSEVGYAQSAPREAAFRRELEMEMDRMRAFLGLACGP
jgi:uncharacterized protein YcaQ